MDLPKPPRDWVPPPVPTDGLGTPMPRPPGGPRVGRIWLAVGALSLVALVLTALLT